MKLRIGKLNAGIGAIRRAVVRGSLERLAITPAHLAVLSSLPLHHRDPFDHLLIAQAIAEDVLFMSDDQNMPLYLVQLMACTAP